MRSSLELPASDLRVIVEHLPVGLMVHRDQAILFVNSALLRMLGYADASELVGQDPRILASPDDAAMVEARIKRSYDGKFNVPVQQQIMRKDGSRAHVEAGGIPVVFSGVAAAMVVFRDISEYKKAEEEALRSKARQKQLEENLLQSQKMEAVGQLAGGVAHDFNNIMMAIILNCQVMLEERGPQPGPYDRLEEVLASCESAVALTKQLLTFSRLRKVETQLLDFNLQVSAARPMLKRLLRANIELSLDLEPGLGWISADPSQIEQVLINLGINARDAMPGGGKLKIGTSHAEFGAGSRAEMLGLAAGHYVRLSVQDEGGGMSASVKERIFEPFFSTTGPGSGTGLGLSTVYGIVKGAGGAIEVDSRPGQGCRFEIYLPQVAGGSGNTKSPSGKPVGALPGGNETLLLVEDEPALRRVLGVGLRAKGYEVIEAQGGQQALEIAASMPQAPAAIITDLVMPGIDGIALAAAMLQKHGVSKVIFMSGHADPVISRDAPEFPKDNFFQKPVRLELILARLRELLDA